MAATHFLFGDPDWYGVLAYAVIFFGSLGGFVLVVCFIYVKVFRGSRKSITTISYDGAGGREDERS